MPHIAKKQDRTVLLQNWHCTSAFKYLKDKYKISDACMIDIDRNPSNEERTNNQGYFI